MELIRTRCSVIHLQSSAFQALGRDPEVGRCLILTGRHNIIIRLNRNFNKVLLILSDLLHNFTSDARCLVATNSYCN